MPLNKETKLPYLWHKTQSLEHLVRIEITNNSLQIQLIKHDTTRDAPKSYLLSNWAVYKNV